MCCTLQNTHKHSWKHIADNKGKITSTNYKGKDYKEHLHTRKASSPLCISPLLSICNDQQTVSPTGETSVEIFIFLT